MGCQGHSEGPRISPAVGAQPGGPEWPWFNADAGLRPRSETGTLSLQAALLPGPDTHTTSPS